MVKAVVLGAAGKSIISVISGSSRYLRQCAGGIGQPLALLLKANPLVTEARLLLYNILWIYNKTFF